MPEWMITLSIVQSMMMVVPPCAAKTRPVMKGPMTRPQAKKTLKIELDRGYSAGHTMTPCKASDRGGIELKQPPAITNTTPIIAKD